MHSMGLKTRHSVFCHNTLPLSKMYRSTHKAHQVTVQYRAFHVWFWEHLTLYMNHKWWKQRAPASKHTYYAAKVGRSLGSLCQRLFTIKLQAKLVLRVVVWCRQRVVYSALRW